MWKHLNDLPQIYAKIQFVHGLLHICNTHKKVKQHQVKIHQDHNMMQVYMCDNL